VAGDRRRMHAICGSGPGRAPNVRPSQVPAASLQHAAGGLGRCVICEAPSATLRSPTDARSALADVLPNRPAVARWQASKRFSGPLLLFYTGAEGRGLNLPDCVHPRARSLQRNTALPSTAPYFRTVAEMPYRITRFRASDLGGIERSQRGIPCEFLLHF
jgi:hypothetical protein